MSKRKQTGDEIIAVVAVVRGSTSDVEPPKATLPKSATERIEALRNAGVNVDNLFAMKGANGGEYVASNQDGRLAILGDDNPIFKQIIEQGTVPNRSLFRRWVMAQMFQMLSATPYNSRKPYGVTAMIRRKGYDYQWKMLLNELHAQMKMEKRDAVNFSERNRWYNIEVVVAMVEDYIKQLKGYVDSLPVRKCKKVPYKRIGGKDIFVDDLHRKLYAPLYAQLNHIKRAKSISYLYNATRKFSDMRLRLPSDTPQCKEWIDAYKGAGAFFTMQNLIRFHACTAFDDSGKRLDKARSLIFIETKAQMYCRGEGWRLLALLKKLLEDNNIDIKKKQAQWRKK